MKITIGIMRNGEVIVPVIKAEEDGDKVTLDLIRQGLQGMAPPDQIFSFAGKLYRFWVSSSKQRRRGIWGNVTEEMQLNIVPVTREGSQPASDPSQVKQGTLVNYKATLYGEEAKEPYYKTRTSIDVSRRDIISIEEPCCARFGDFLKREPPQYIRSPDWPNDEIATTDKPLELPLSSGNQDMPTRFCPFCGAEIRFVEKLRVTQVLKSSSTRVQYSYEEKPV